MFRHSAGKSSSPMFNRAMAAHPPLSNVSFPKERKSYYPAEPGFGQWKNGRHEIAVPDQRLEKKLFGLDDLSKQHTGINFEKYDAIPVEATGAGVPDAIISFTESPLHHLLLENIGLARYSTPTPVQKYSIPIVAANRDLMACAQVRMVYCNTAVHVC